MGIKQPTQKQIGEYIFYIRPFSAFKSANISGDLVSLISPILVSILPALTGGAEDEEKSILDMDISAAMPSIMKACSTLDGDKVEHLMRTLLTKNRNISFEHEEEHSVSWLDDDAADDIFTGNVEDMFMLAFEVIKLNFNGFFKKLGNLSGNPGELLSQMMNSTNTDTSTAADSAI